MMALEPVPRDGRVRREGILSADVHVDHDFMA